LLLLLLLLLLLFLVVYLLFLIRDLNSIDGVWNASEERDCFINGFSFAKELTKSIGFKTNERDRTQRDGGGNNNSNNPTGPGHFSNNSHQFARAKSALLFEVDAFSPAPSQADSQSSPRQKHAILRGLSPVRSGGGHSNVMPSTQSHQQQQQSTTTSTTTSPTSSNNISNDKRAYAEQQKVNAVQFFDPFKVEDNPFAR
jgi:hypothetical protein